MVEHCLAKAGVAGSNPVSRSIFLYGGIAKRKGRGLQIPHSPVQIRVPPPKKSTTSSLSGLFSLFSLFYPSSLPPPSLTFSRAELRINTVACSNPQSICPDGGTGRRRGLKIPWGFPRAGSSPAPGTTLQVVHPLPPLPEMIAPSNPFENHHRFGPTLTPNRAFSPTQPSKDGHKM